MRIAVAADHAGFDLKEQVKSRLSASGHEVMDLGGHDHSSSDYPDFAEAAATALLQARSERAVVICGSGVGVSVAANKVPGIRAAVCHDHYSAHQGVEHDDMNVLCLGARIIGTELAFEVIDAFIGARFSEEARHVRRLEKVKAIEAKYLRVERTRR